MSNFIDDNGQSQDEWYILALFNFDTVFITNGEEFLGDRCNQVMVLLDLEFARSKIALDLEGAMFGLHREFLAAQKVQFTARGVIDDIIEPTLDSSLLHFSNDFIVLTDFILCQTEWIDHVFDYVQEYQPEDIAEIHSRTYSSSIHFDHLDQSIADVCRDPVV